MGAWVETKIWDKRWRQCKVAPRMGAWVETTRFDRVQQSNAVAPRMGAWVETGIKPLAVSDEYGRSPHGGVG